MILGLHGENCATDLILKGGVKTQHTVVGVKATSIVVCCLFQDFPTVLFFTSFQDSCLQPFFKPLIVVEKKKKEIKKFLAICMLLISQPCSPNQTTDTVFLKKSKFLSDKYRSPLLLPNHRTRDRAKNFSVTV